MNEKALRNLLRVLSENQMIRLEGGSRAEKLLFAASKEFLCDGDGSLLEHAADCLGHGELQELQRDKQILAEENAELRKQCEDYQKMVERFKSERNKYIAKANLEQTRAEHIEKVNEDLEKEYYELSKRLEKANKMLMSFRKALEEIIELNDDEDGDEDEDEDEACFIGRP